MIDTQQLQSMAGDTPEVILEILGDFQEEALLSLNEIPSLFSEERFKEASGILHQLAGSSGSLGLSSFYKKVRILEDDCKKEGSSVESLREARELLKRSVEEARCFLKEGPP